MFSSMYAFFKSSSVINGGSFSDLALELLRLLNNFVRFYAKLPCFEFSGFNTRNGIYKFLTFYSFFTFSGVSLSSVKVIFLVLGLFFFWFLCKALLETTFGFVSLKSIIGYLSKWYSYSSLYSLDLKILTFFLASSNTSFVISCPRI